MTAKKAKLSHLDRRGDASMVDVSAKSSTVRRALAEGRIMMSAAAFKAVRDAQLAKGDVLGTARIATLQLKNSSLKTGLSWPNLAKVVGHPADPQRWGVLYLGTAATSSIPASPAGEYDPVSKG